MSVVQLREMFDRMVVGKNAELIERYYDPDFVMHSDGLTQDFAEFHRSHREIYSTPISYAIEYDEQAWVETPQTRWPGGYGSPRHAPVTSRPASKLCSSPPSATAGSTGSGRPPGRVGATWPHSKIIDTQPISEG
jgi:hypothetical protein